MTYLNLIAREWHELVCRDEFSEYQDIWICDEVFFSHLATHKPLLKDMHSGKGKFARETLVRAIPTLFPHCESLVGKPAVFRHRIRMFCPLQNTNRVVWFIFVSKTADLGYAPTKEEIEQAFRPRKRRSGRISQIQETGETDENRRRG